MVASAFQYGWAPTLMPQTTTWISPPPWVKVERLSTRSPSRVPVAVRMLCIAAVASPPALTMVLTALSSVT